MKIDYTVSIENGAEACKEEKASEKKTVFLIGDSIRIHYSPYLRKIMGDSINIYEPSENCRNTHYILTALCVWPSICDLEKVDLVLFNAGHWDSARWEHDDSSLTPIPEYKKNIGKIIRRIRQSFPNAKHVFVTTTPINEQFDLGRNPRTAEDIINYNAAALEVVEAEGIPYYDAHAYMMANGEDHHEDACHYNSEGRRILAEFIAGKIKEEFNM
jgi:hypothetical protein